MDFHGIGIREGVALVALAGGLAIGAAFCNPSASQNSSDPRPTPTPRARETADGLSSWNVSFVDGDYPASNVVVAHGEFPTLDVSFDGAPFPDMKDDHWSLFASATFSGEPGRRFFEVKWTGELGLQVNGQDMGVTPGSGTEHQIRLPFEQGAAPSSFTVRLTDTGGPARVSARVVNP